MKYRADITIVGAGVVGLAIASELADVNTELYLLEKNDTFGLETSSRNSQVIHSGIHYPPDTLKALMCVEGNRLLYEICQQHAIGCHRLGKLTVATNDHEIECLHNLMATGNGNGVPGLRLLSAREMHQLEPEVAGVAALLSPSTGIINAHGLMKFFLGRAVDNGAQVAYRAEVVGIEKMSGSFRVTVKDASGLFSFATTVLINSAGLHADEIAALAGIDLDEAGYRLHYCKGDYFQVGGGKSKRVNRLIYPAPQPDSGGLGIHITLDLEHRMRLGPSDYRVERLDYAVDQSQKPAFYESAKKLLPFLEYDDLEPDMAGIRPRLQAPAGSFRDFVISEESARGLPGLVDLVGIESPGLTSAPAIARYVKQIVGQLRAG